MSNIINKIRLSGTDYTLSATTSGGTEVVEVTQAEYDALVSGGTVDPTVFYIITDAQPVDISNYWTSAQTQSAINQATSEKVDKSSVVSSVTSASTDNEIPTAKAVWEAASGGGTTYSAGTNISIANDTISCTLPISYGGMWGHSINLGRNDNKLTSGDYNLVQGVGTEVKNNREMSCCSWNVSNKANNTWGDSGNTLFSVGNGTEDNARHNAFEIRQNGDIYLSLNGQDVKLQDQLGGGSITVDTALDSGSTNPVENRVIYNKIDEVEQVTAAALNNINDRLSEDEEVTAAALNALNDTIGNINTILESI